MKIKRPNKAQISRSVTRSGFPKRKYSNAFTRRLLISLERAAAKPREAAKNTPITVSLAKPVFSRTKAIAAPTTAPKVTITGATHSQKLSSLLRSPSGFTKILKRRKPKLTPANAQWARASLKNAIRLPTTILPTAPQSRLTARRANKALIFSGSPKKVPVGNKEQKWSKTVNIGPSTAQRWLISIGSAHQSSKIGPLGTSKGWHHGLAGVE